MDYHLESGLKLNISPEHKSLYSWAINETDAGGQVASRDQIPWRWSLYFTATEFTVSESVKIVTRDRRGTAKDAADISQRSVIRAKLRPGQPLGGGEWSSGPTYRMFGSDRVISDFQLDIMPLETAEEPEGCHAWGCVSYTYEIDFKNETNPDSLTFYLMVRQERFDRYVWNIAQGIGDEMWLSVGQVDGLYSEWSPSVSTRSIKVLTSGKEQKVEMPDLAGSEMPQIPRIGAVGEVEFSMNSRRVVKPPEAGPSQD